MNKFYYKSWFWIALTILLMGLFFVSCLPDVLQYTDKLVGDNAIWFTLIPGIGFTASIGLGFFFTQRGKGETEIAAIEETGKSMFRMGILYKIIGIIIVLGFLINLALRVPNAESFRGIISDPIINAIELIQKAQKGVLNLFNHSSAGSSEKIDQIAVSNINPETANWKTYTNTQYGFEMKYPTGAFFSEYVCVNYPDGTLNLFCASIKIDKMAILHINIIKKPLNFINLNEYLVQEEQNCKTESKDAVAPVWCHPAEKITIGNESGLSFTVSDATVMRNTYVSVYLERGNNLLKLSYSFSGGLIDYYISDIEKNNQGLLSSINKEKARYDTVQKILSTFKFTNVTDETGWKTYTNNKYGFEIKYPGDFYLSTKPDFVTGGDITIISNVPNPWPQDLGPNEKVTVNVYRFLNDGNHSIDYLMSNQVDFIGGEKILVSEETAVRKITEPRGTGGMVLTYFVHNDGYVYVVRGSSGTTEYFNQYLELIKEIENTFKFIN